MRGWHWRVKGNLRNRTKRATVARQSTSRLQNRREWRQISTMESGNRRISTGAGSILLAGLAVAMAGGCGSRETRPNGGEVDYIYEASKEPHVMGFDSTGMPVYGLDENGKPVYKPEKE